MGDNRRRISYFFGISNKKYHFTDVHLHTNYDRLLFKLSNSRNRLGTLEIWQLNYQLKTLLKNHFHVLKTEE